MCDGAIYCLTVDVSRRYNKLTKNTPGLEMQLHLEPPIVVAPLFSPASALLLVVWRHPVSQLLGLETDVKPVICAGSGVGAVSSLLYVALFCNLK